MIDYPKVRRDEEYSENFHGKDVADPYHWLSDPDSEETKAFVKAQNNLTKPYIESLPEREKIKERLTQIWDYPKNGCPKKKGSRYFYHYNSGLQNQSVVLVRDTLWGEPRLFFDPNLLSEDGTISLNTTSYSEDGELFAYGLSESGSDWITIRIKKVSNGEDFPEVLKNVKFTAISWTHDNLGFFYSCYPKLEGDGTEINDYTNQQLYYHRVGTEQSQDILCMEFPEKPHWLLSAEVTDCGNYVILSVQEDCKNNMLFYFDLEKLGPEGIQDLLPFSCLVLMLDSRYDYITNIGSKLIIQTNYKAPCYRLILLDIEHPQENNWEDLVPEEEHVLEWAACVAHDKLILCYLKDVKNILVCSDLNTGEQIATFPLEVGTITSFSGAKKYNEIFYLFTSFLTPGIIYHCDLGGYLTTLNSEVFQEIKVPGFDSSKFEIRQEFFYSKDRTLVPMYIVHLKDLVPNTPGPCLLYGYGGFNISLLPSFNPARIMFLQHFRGYYAVANIRGGGEFGDTWHNSGRLTQKQNSFDDFESAIAHLFAKNYTDPKKIIIQGGSNGGLLMGAIINRVPRMIGCAIVQVGVLDMLRFHKYTIGRMWCSDYGCSEKEDQFEYLLKYSPLHNIRMPKEGQYPATLLMTADHDDRVVPLHSFKFISELQHTVGKHPGQTQPLMIRVETNAGHGGGMPTSKIIENYTDIYCFIIKSLELPYFQ